MKTIKEYLIESSRLNDFMGEWTEQFNNACDNGNKDDMIEFYEELLGEVLDMEWHHNSQTPNREDKEAYNFLINLKLRTEGEMEKMRIDYKKISKDFKSNWKEPKY